MRILHCAGFNEQKLGRAFYSTDRKISNGLIRNGHCVYDFSYRYYAKQHTPFFLKYKRPKTAESALIEISKHFEPDVLLLGKSENISYKALENIRNDFPEIKIGMWWVDPIYILGDIRKKLSLIDAFFLTTDPRELKRIFEDDSIFLKSHFMPNICDSSIDIYRGFENKEYKHDVLFIGRTDKNRQNFIEVLSSLNKKINLGLYGQGGNLLLGNRYLKTIANSKISLNFSRYNDLSMYSSDRLVHLAANGSLVVSSRIPNMENIFNQDEVVYFDNLDEMVEKVRYYLSNDLARLKIAEKGYQKAHTEYESKIVTKKMMDSILIF